MTGQMPSAAAAADDAPAASLSLWDLAGIAVAALAVATHQSGGAQVRSAAGPVRDAWLASLRALLPPQTPVLRMPSAIGDDRLLGGLDLAATLATGRPAAQRGLMAECNDGLLIAPMAERMATGTAAHLAAALDRGVVVTERDGLAMVSPARFGIVALDEGEADDPTVPPALTDRLAFRIDLRELSHRDIAPFPYSADDIAAARLRLPQTNIDTEALNTLATIGEALGVPSVRTLTQAAAVARAIAALNDMPQASADEVSLAAALVYAPRATRLPATDPEDQAEQPEPPEQPEDQLQNDSEQANGETRPLDDVVLDAAVAAIPAGLLAQLAAGMAISRSRRAGKAGAQQKQATRGRKIGTRAADARGAIRIDLFETLKAAAPWQRMRRSKETAEDVAAPLRIHVKRDDLRQARYRHRAETTTIFVVDASGSSALQRLAEAKGAVRLLLAECYIRRDEVALIAFRGQGADLLLAPTRALTHAQRALAGLPGGGGTPVASGLIAAQALATQVAREGRTPVIVVMTDGKANVARDGAHGRPKAQEDACNAARLLAATGFSCLLVDTSPQPQPLAENLARLMQARYLPLPRADARRVAAAVSAATGGAKSQKGAA